jgi:hypothetical protein
MPEERSSSTKEYLRAARANSLRIEIPQVYLALSTYAGAIDDSRKATKHPNPKNWYQYG